jgi:hypothetical protein
MVNAQQEYEILALMMVLPSMMMMMMMMMMPYWLTSDTLLIACSQRIDNHSVGTNKHRSLDVS